MGGSDYIVRHLVMIPCTIVTTPPVIRRYDTSSRIQQSGELPYITTANALKGAPWQLVNKKGRFEATKVNGCYRINSGEMAGWTAISGVGFTILSEQACQPYTDDG